MKFLTIPLYDTEPDQAQHARIGFNGNHDFREMITTREIDFLIISAELGFSPLSANFELIGESLGIDNQAILEIAQTIQDDPEHASIVYLNNHNTNNRGLRGALLITSENSTYFRKNLAQANDQRRKSVYYFALTYESLVIALNEARPKKIGMTHISAGGQIDPGILAHSIDAFIQANQVAINPAGQFAFVGCCIEWSTVEEGARMVNNQYRGRQLQRVYFEESELLGFRRITAIIR